MKNLKALFLLFLGGCFWLAVFGALTGIQYLADRPNCTNQTISYSTKTVDDPNSDLGTDTISVKGVNGVAKVCRNDSHEVVSRKTIISPVTEIKKSGTRTVFDSIPAYSGQSEPFYEPSAYCADGTYSYSTGSGTCSWHGGVAEWLY